MSIKIRYENEIPVLRSATIECPECSEEFNAMCNGKCDSGDGYLHDYIDLKYGLYKCPKCKHKFGTRGEDLDIEHI